VETQNTGAGIDTLREIENVWGTNFTDSITGDNVANHLRGEGGSDWLWGNGGADTIDGGAGADAIAGGAGVDILIGGSGNDHMWGGSGGDTFKFSSGWGDDWVWDFQIGGDKLDLSGVAGLNNLIQIDIDSTADGALVTYGTSSVLLIGVDSTLLNDSHFII
jgi:Ca2+-binding RTX toxin-like protein